MILNSKFSQKNLFPLRYHHREWINYTEWFLRILSRLQQRFYENFPQKFLLHRELNYAELNFQIEENRILIFTITIEIITKILWKFSSKISSSPWTQLRRT